MFAGPRRVRPRTGAGLALLVVAGAFLMLAAQSGGAAGPFSPQADVRLWDPNPSAPSGIITTTWVGTGSPTMGTWSLDMPVGWDITPGSAVPVGNRVAEAAMSVDVDCNGSVEEFGPVPLNNQPIDPQAVADWTGNINPWWVLTVSVDGTAQQGYDLSADLTTITQPHTLCAPQVFQLTLLGQSLPGGVQLLHNPGAGTHTFTVLSVSSGGAYAADDPVPVSVQAAMLPATDVDGDGVIDELRCGSDPWDSARRPERTDGVFAGVDDNGNGVADEMPVPGSSNYDCDGDGYKGTVESGNPLCGNGANDDGLIFGGADDGVVDDGCPGGPAVAGAYSEAAFNIGLDDQDPCGNNGWPAELAGGDDRVTLQDITSFTVPAPRKFGTSPGAPGFNQRWDLVPGGGGGTWIVLSDLTALTTGPMSRPPMLGGARAFGGPSCPSGTTPSPTPTPSPAPTPTPTPTPAPTPTPTPLPGGDSDGDGVVDEVPCGSDPNSATSRPERLDGGFAAADDDGDTLVDEALPAGAAGFDCDGDGFKGASESGRPLCGNGINDDGVLSGGTSDDGVVDDGCPGGPAQIGIYSEAQFKIGLSDQDACGNNGWPAELAGGDNKVSLADITSFVVPAPRKFGTSPGDAGFNSRWDLIPGRVGSAWIVLSDLTSLTTGPTAFPPMLMGARAFGGPACPWPP